MYQAIKSVFKHKNIKEAKDIVTESINKKKVKLSDISLRGLWEAVVGPGTSQSFINHNKGFIGGVQEADVKTSALNDIIGVVLANEIISAYEAVPKVSPYLVTTYKSTNKDERVPGFTAMPDGGEVEEDENYPEYGLSAKYVLTGDKKKRGGIVHVTEEAIMNDQTGILIEHVKSLAEMLALRKEKNVVSGVTGGHICYYPSGTATSLYGALPYLIAANALVDWTDVDKAEQDGLNAMTDENGEPIAYDSPNKVLLVPSALKYTAKSIVNATQIERGKDSESNRQFSKSPIADENIQVVSSRYVSVYTGNDTSWFYGDPRKQFLYKEIFPLQVSTLPTNNTFEFMRDVKFSYKVREWGWVFARDNKYFVKNNA